MATSYDGDLQMFREPSCEPDLGVLRFLRWLAERGELEHELSGVSSGELADLVESVPAEIDPPRFLHRPCQFTVRASHERAHRLRRGVER
jgi:hypothetical protein